MTVGLLQDRAHAGWWRPVDAGKPWVARPNAAVTRPTSRDDRSIGVGMS
jgi:hypothetical protein